MLMSPRCICIARRWMDGIRAASYSKWHESTCELLDIRYHYLKKSHVLFKVAQADVLCSLGLLADSPE